VSSHIVEWNLRFWHSWTRDADRIKRAARDTKVPIWDFPAGPEEEEEQCAQMVAVARCGVARQAKVRQPGVSTGASRRHGLHALRQRMGPA